MANLIEYIQSQIYENSTEDISGSIMQQVLTRMASDEGVVNVHTISGQTPFADYNNAQAARDAVPAGFKKLGLIITYKLSSGWYIDEFIGSATSGWSTASNWKCLGPISVSQNASTGKTTITIGSESFDVATQPVSVSQNTRTTAPDWQPNTHYEIGDVVNYEGGNFECVIEHTSGLMFIDNQATQWISKGNSGEDEISVGTEKVNVINAKKLYQIKFFGTTQSGLSVGDIYYNTDYKQLRRVNSRSPIFTVLPFYEGAIYTYNNTLYIWDGTELVKKGQTLSISKNTTTGKIEITLDNDTTVIINGIDTAPIKNSDNFVLSGGIYEEQVDNATRLRWENGGFTVQIIGDDTYLINDNSRTDCIRTIEIPLPQAIRFDVNNPNLRFAWFIVDKNGIRQNQYSLDASPTHNIYVWDSSIITNPDKWNWRVRIVVINNNGDIADKEEVLSSVIIEPLNDKYVRNGKQVLIYKFGAEGNDWCFVRTPENYNQFRQKPYPFVICNHGNGWVMDGTPQKANWTKRTMYVPLDDPDYIADPDQYNGTSDESLWYSNPTIEALLSAGYVVCGCENYGDNLYGNENCRKACAAFFEHMVKTYNVEKRCCMIGASNGAQTSINAAYLLGDKVKAMILQYPLTCLVNQYFSHTDHQAPIRQAYGITDTSIDETGLISATRTHDVLHTDIFDGVRLDYFPPTKLYYSPSDSVVNYQQNALALFNMLDNSLKIVKKKECSGGHGDYSHFAPSEYVDFLNTY